MKRVKFYLSNGYYSQRKEIFEYPNDITDEELDDEYNN